ncbi:MAG TPA: sodium:proton antiporter NhaD [Terracidiphilus sp.]|nr:sodium:proton antiporter NhaD [Terracidiphilus sp.]
MTHANPWAGPAILAVFCITYALVFAEEKLHLRKSKPVMVGAAIIWILVAIAYQRNGSGALVGAVLRDVLTEYAELFLFLLSAMSFVNAMVERNVFEVLRARLSSMRLTARGVFWVTGIIAFALSPVADNLTTALVMGTVVMATLGNRSKAVVGALVSVVVAANAGGAFSPFGDITTLMIWQKGVVQFAQFFNLFLPALISWLIPAFIISFTIPRQSPEEQVYPARLRRGAWVIVIMFALTIAATVFLDHFLHLPPFLGMMMGLGVLNFYSYFLSGAHLRRQVNGSAPFDITSSGIKRDQAHKPFDMFAILEKVEWDTLLFFYGIMFCVGGLGAIGYLEGLSRFLYGGLGPTHANILVGLVSAVVDNIPLTFAVLTMHPVMNSGQWLLITLTAGIGGSLLSVGSAAGVALMGISRGKYTFLSHLKWTGVILLGYAAGIAAHLLLNSRLFVN